MTQFLGSGCQTHTHNDPFLHWTLNNVLPQSTVNTLLDLAVDIDSSNASAKRTEHNSRCFLTDGELADAANGELTRSQLGSIVGQDLQQARLRMELCVDAPGFSLEPHIDIPEKLITLQIYLDGERHCGTNLYPKTVPCEPNTGWMIVNTPDTTHGFDTRVFEKRRVSLIVNYVDDNWWDVAQLYQGK